MSTQSADDYLQAKVMTATPQKLHLMLIEGAIRCVRVAEEAWDDENRRSEAHERLVRAIDIVGELLAGVRNADHDVAERLEQLYQFVLGRLAVTFTGDDREPLSEALRVLEYERETWQLLCEKIAADEGGDAKQASHGASLTPPVAAPPPVAGEGFSLEA